ncbi:Putative ribonuclease H protein [Dendrobium catenatum]|uniref:Ribonuclease H protein n=1 Tax=Dendrobium catenatum TaxID=906689 RepID=A0A2I0W791_9ASPA|nr:Putative ribonuclease H protein [Dendrobium catenatum]
MAVTIIWFIWLDRNDAKYRNIAMNHKRIIARTKEKINSLYKANLFKNSHFRGFKLVIKKLGIIREENKEEVVPKFVKWIKPKDKVIKINTDGSMASNKWGCGGILRNAEGNMICGFAGPLSCCNVPYAELMALFQALKITLSMGILRVWIEVDALLVLHFLNPENNGNVENFYTLREIKGMLSHMDYVISHIGREGNACADFLARLGDGLAALTYFDNSNIPVLLRGLIRLDKDGLPYLRK